MRNGGQFVSASMCLTISGDVYQWLHWFDSSLVYDIIKDSRYNAVIYNTTIQTEQQFNWYNLDQT